MNGRAKQILEVNVNRATKTLFLGFYEYIKPKSYRSD